MAWAEGGTPGATVGGTPASLLPLTNNIWLRLFAIRKNTGQIDAGLDTNENAAALLAAAGASYTEFRQIAWIRHGTAQIVPYIQEGDEFVWEDRPLDLTLGTSAVGVPFTSTAPPSSKAHLALSHIGGASRICSKLFKRNFVSGTIKMNTFISYMTHPKNRYGIAFSFFTIT